MKSIVFSLFIALFLSAQFATAQDVTTVEAKSEEISDNLDLEAVASVFGEAESLEDFEKRLNDPDSQISNLDLNEDGEVDYLRVVETAEDETHVIAIQAVLGEDQFQDVATIVVEKDDKGDTSVQVVGDVYMYGPSYVIQPVYVRPPVFFVFFWGPAYRPWYSPYYWGYYPPYYRPWRPYPPHLYRSNVHVHINVNNTYKRTNVNISNRASDLQRKNSRSDYAKKHPDRSFEKRNKGVSNRQELNNRNKAGSANPKVSTGRKVDQNWQPKSGSGGKQKVTTKTTPSQPNTRPATQPANRQQGATTRPQSRPATTPAAKPAATPAPKPAAKPAARPATPKANPAGGGKRKR